VLEVLRGARPLPLAGAFLLYGVVGSVVRGCRWQVLVTSLGYPIRLRRATELFLVGTFFNQLLPTGIGGDVVRSLVLAREGLGRARAASTVMVDRAIGILMQLAAGILALGVARGHASGATTAVLLGAVGLGLAGSALFLRADLWRARAAELPVVGSFFARGAVARFVDSFAEYGARTLAVSAAWSFGFTAALIGTNALLGRAVGITQAGLADWFLIVPVVALTTLVPSMAGWGVREVTYVSLLGALRPPVPADTATAMGLVFGGMNLALAAAGGLLAARGAMGPPESPESPA